ncbi:MAG: ABC transporter ATP-binding protein [Planctomycetota bacterium]
MSSPVLRARAIEKEFALKGRGKGAEERRLRVLHGIDLELAQGERLALVGSSGAGKSTLLHILGLLDRPSAGEVEVEGKKGWQIPLAERAALRNRRIGFVFQFYHLLPELTALENVQLPAMIAESRLSFRAKKRELRARAEALLGGFGLTERLHHRPAQLSGGERQRVAMARALFLDPVVLLADEPTGNLDSKTGELVLELLLAEQQRRKLSMILVTHDERIAARCDRILAMKDGRVVAESAGAGAR